MWKLFRTSPPDPAPEAEWQVWYQDTFDRECPPSVDVRGRGLVSGLTELWARHLFETVRPGGDRRRAHAGGGGEQGGEHTGSMGHGG